MIEVIGFDADDTLWHNEILYHQAKEELGHILADYRDPAEIKEWLDQKLLGKIFSVSVDMGEYLPSWHPWEDYRQSYAGKENMGGGVRREVERRGVRIGLPL